MTFERRLNAMLLPSHCWPVKRPMRTSSAQGKTPLESGVKGN
jgi:hypothetical protein